MDWNPDWEPYHPATVLELTGENGNTFLQSGSRSCKTDRKQRSEGDSGNEMFRNHICHVVAMQGGSNGSNIMS